jgi:hypothetical protein
MICLGFDVGSIENICHLDDTEEADWRNPLKLVTSVLTAEGLLGSEETSDMEISTKLSELYKTMCLSFTTYKVVQVVLSER